MTAPDPLPNGASAQVVLAPAAAAVALARSAVRDVCGRAGLDVATCDDAVLLTSEIVTNAFTHGRSDARLRADADQQAIVVQVADDNSRHPTAVPRDVNALDGRGIHIVDLLAARWGVRDDPFGKTVWFEVRAG